MERYSVSSMEAEPRSPLSSLTSPPFASSSGSRFCKKRMRGSSPFAQSAAAPEFAAPAPRAPAAPREPAVQPEGKRFREAAAAGGGGGGVAAMEGSTCSSFAPVRPTGGAADGSHGLARSISPSFRWFAPLEATASRLTLDEKSFTRLSWTLQQLTGYRSQVRLLLLLVVVVWRPVP